MVFNRFFAGAGRSGAATGRSPQAGVFCASRRLCGGLMRRGGCLLALAAVLVAGPCAAYAAVPAHNASSSAAGTPPAVADEVQTLARTGQWEDVLQATGGVAPSLSLPSADVRIVRYRAEALLALDRAGEALTLAARGLALEPDNAVLLALRGDAQLALGYPQRAAEDYHAALTSDAESWRAMHGMALVARTAGDTTAALEWYDRLVPLQPDRPLLRMERAILEHEAGLVARARRDMEVVAMLAPENPDVWNNRGMMYLAQGDAQKAMADFDKALRLDPEHAGALLNRGNLWRERLDLHRSLHDLDNGVRLHPRNVRMLVARMYTHVALQQYPAGLADLEAAYSVNSLDTYLLNEFAWFLATVPDAALRDGGRAVRYAREALDLSPVPVASYFDTLAAAYAAQGRFDMAVPAQERALLMAMDRAYPETVLGKWRQRLELYRNKQPYSSGK